MTPKRIAAAERQRHIPTQFVGQKNFCDFFKAPLHVVKDACRNPKCSGFRNGRVQTVEMLQFIFSQKKSEAGINWKLDLEQSKAKRERIKLAEDEGRMADKSVIEFGLNKIESLHFSSLIRLAKIELPPALKGLTEIEMQTLLINKFDKLKFEMSEQLLKLAEKQTKDD